MDVLAAKRAELNASNRAILMVKIGDPVALQKAREEEERKVATQSFSKKDVIRSHPC